MHIVTVEHYYLHFNRHVLGELGLTSSLKFSTSTCSRKETIINATKNPYLESWVTFENYSGCSSVICIHFLGGQYFGTDAQCKYM